MSKRDDIVDGKEAEARKYGLVYTRKCGWIDLGHANPASAADLWRRVQAAGHMCTTRGYFRLSYGQEMRKLRMSGGVRRTYEISETLKVPEKKAVALSIFLDVSTRFESKQANWFYRWVTDSGFSAEDLVSNLVGFYRAVEPGRRYVEQCEPVSRADALRIWDTFGAVGAMKNYTPSPMLYSVDPVANVKSAMCGQLPDFLNTITPAVVGTLFRDVTGG